MKLGAASPPALPATLLEALSWHVRIHPARPCIRLLDFAAEEPSLQEISYVRLSADAEAVAGGLRRGGFAPGEAVAIMLPTSRDFFVAFLGTLPAGGVAVPVYPPARLAGLEEHLHRQAGILRNALTVVLITVPEARLLGRLLRSQVPSLRQLVTTEDLQASARRARSDYPPGGGPSGLVAGAC